MYERIQELMDALGCDRFPARWEGFYSEVREHFLQKGCELLSPAYYAHLREKYGVLTEYAEIYGQAALAISKKPALSLFLALLVRSFVDKNDIQADVAALSLPAAREGEDAFPYDMLPALAVCTAIPSLYEEMKRRGLPDDVLYPSLRTVERSIDAFRERNNGAYGMANFNWWCHRYFLGTIYRIGRLEFELPVSFPNAYRVLQSKTGEVLSLANMRLHRDGVAIGSLHYEDEEGAYWAAVEETDEAYIGHPIDKKGRALREKITLPKSDWQVRLTGGDPVVGIHIPPGGGFSADALDATFSRAREILATHFPDFPYRAFVTGTWMLDPQLRDLLGAEGNLVKFGERFTRMTMKSAGRSVLNFVFLRPQAEIDFTTLPESTRLERALKAHYLAGNAIYETYGCILK